MNIDVIKNIGRFLVLIAIQVIVLNQIYLGGYISPYIYPMFILMLPFNVNGWVLLLSAFFCGLTVDMFTDSIGMHAAATVFMAFMRPFVIKFISTRDELETNSLPTVDNNGWRWIITYTLLLIFIHHFALFAIEVFRLSELFRIIVRTLFSTTFSAGIIFIAHLLTAKSSKSRI